MVCFGLVIAFLLCMVAIVGKVTRHGRNTMETVLVPGNHTEASGTATWGLVIAGGLLLVTVSFVSIILLSI